jgi:predicted metal-dependent phosphoesterase TrpH
VALTDHDTMKVANAWRRPAAPAGSNSSTATELTAEHDGHELHMLGYFLDSRNEKLRADLAHFQEVRRQRIYEMVGGA